MTGRLRPRMVADGGQDSESQGPSSGEKRKTDPMEEDEHNEAPFYKVITRNRYQVLSDSSDIEVESVKTRKPRLVKKPNNSELVTPKSKIVKPPPLTLHDKHNHRKLADLITAEIGQNFNIKYVKDATLINVPTTEQNFVLKGLSDQTDETQIVKSLEQNKIEVIKCNKMRTYFPTYLVSVSQNTKIEDLVKINSVDNTRVFWEKYVTERRISQCHNCQMWGHATSNCYAEPKCLKCAGPHLTRSCEKTKETAATCINCGGAHPANATICASFLQRQSFLNRNRQERAVQHEHERSPVFSSRPRDFPTLPMYKPAPMPTSNLWQPRPQQQQAPAATATAAPAAPTAPGSFAALASEMKRLNELVDVNKVLFLVRELNSKLINASSQSERVQITIQFFISLDD